MYVINTRDSVTDEPIITDGVVGEDSINYILVFETSLNTDGRKEFMRQLGENGRAMYEGEPGSGYASILIVFRKDDEIGTLEPYLKEGEE